MRARAMLMALAVVLWVGACTSPTKSPYLAEGAAHRDTARAEQLTREGAGLVEDSPTEAEVKFREALAADLFHGPAHNNLGVVFLKRGDLYEAANEFEWARKLMPGHPDPRLNLALTLETAGQPGEAIKAYRAALEVYPEHIATIQGLVRLQLRQGVPSKDLGTMLELVAMRGETKEWKDWARRKLLGPGN